MQNEFDGLSKVLSEEFKNSDFSQQEFSGFQENTTPDKKEVESVDKASDLPEIKEEKEIKSDTDSSLNTEKETEQKKDAEQPVTQRTLDELLSEKTEGKFKSWGDIEKILSEPKEEFADERIKQINQYVKEGGKFDENWLYWATTDFTTMQDDPIELLAMEMRLKDPDITDKEIEYELKREYRMEEWSDDDSEPNEIEQIMSERIGRKAKSALETIKSHQNKLLISPAKEMEVELKSKEEQNIKAKQNWEANVSNLLKDFNSLPIELSENNTFSFELSGELKNEVQKTMVDLWTNPNAIIESFVTKDGIDAKGLAETIVKIKNFNKIVSIAIKNAQNVGKKEVIDGLKNADFVIDSKSTSQKSKTMEQQIGEQIINQMNN